MSEVNVGAAASFSDPGRKVFDLGGTEVGVFLLDGAFYAWENRCPHLDGPACQGRLLPLSTEAVNEDRTSRGREFSKSRTNVVCPWHGFEFDIRTGEHPTDPRVRLKAVPLRVENGEIWVSVRDRR